MGVFGNKEDKIQKAQEKERKELEKFMSRYNLKNLSIEDLEVLKRISTDLAGNGFFKIGMALSFSKAEEQAKVTYLSALVEQNWLVIKQLGDLNNKLDALMKK